jgi:RHS repeat-associated protein
LSSLLTLIRQYHEPCKLYRAIGYTYDAVGNILTVTDPDAKYTYEYDALNRVISVDNAGTTGVPTVAFNYLYDTVGRLVTVGDRLNNTNAGQTDYTFDQLNRVTSITQTGVGVQSKRVDMNYNKVNQMTGLRRFSDLGGANLVAESSYVYDQSQRLTQLAHKKGVNNLASYDYTYDSANKLTKIVSSVDGTVDYTYDATNQLTGADHSSQADEAYQYDANGNRSNAGYQTGTNNQLLADGQFTYEYDHEGNRTKRTEAATGKVTEYLWDYHNRLTGVVFKDAAGAVLKNIEYIYDVNNQRIGKKIDGVVTERYVLDRNQIALVFDGQGVQKSRYLYGTQVDQVLAEESGTQVRWFLADHQGTVKDVIDNAGIAIDHITYDSFGRIVSQTNPIELRFAYTGREWDGETGQYYYRARYYDPADGRFISEDPIGFTARDANLSRYVGNSPTMSIDPTGNMALSLVKTLISSMKKNLAHIHYGSLPPDSNEGEELIKDINPNSCDEGEEFAGNKGGKKKKPLGRNPLCKKGSGSVGLSKARLEDIARYYGIYENPDPDHKGGFRSNVGNAFERTIARSIQVAGTGLDYRKVTIRGFKSPTRAANTNGKVTGVSPDLLGTMVVEKVNARTLKSETWVYPNSSIVEIKATSGDLAPNYNKYQISGILDYAKFTPAARDGVPPSLTFVTTSDTRISELIRVGASVNMIDLYQSIARESCAYPGRIAPGKGTLLTSGLTAYVVSEGVQTTSGHSFSIPIPIREKDFQEFMP